MAFIPSPFKFTYGQVSVGGSSGIYRVDGPHTISRGKDQLTVKLSVTVVATSRSGLKGNCKTLEEAFTLRDKTLTIDLDNVDNAGVSTFVYTAGENFLNPRSEIEKSGDEITDKGWSRNYMITISGGLASVQLATDGTGEYSGLREINYSLTYSPSRARAVSISGIYTATPAQTSPSRAALKARVNYRDASTGIDAEVTAYLSVLASEFLGSFEMIQEQVDEDKENDVVTFSRVYRELLEDQSANLRDNTNIRDHTFTFTEQIDQPGDSGLSLFRLRQVACTYECAVDVQAMRTAATNMYEVFRDEIRPHMIGLFREKFTPAQWCITSRQVGYDTQRQRISAVMEFTYKKAGGSKVLQSQTTVRTVINRTPEFTPMHENNEFAMELDIGFALKTRTTTNVTVSIGDDPDLGEGGQDGGLSVSGGGKGGAAAVKIGDDRGGGPTQNSGGGGSWVELTDDREQTSVYIGMSEETQILVTTTTMIKVEQYFEFPKGRTSVKF